MGKTKTSECKELFKAPVAAKPKKSDVNEIRHSDGVKPTEPCDHLKTVFFLTCIFMCRVKLSEKLSQKPSGSQAYASFHSLSTSSL